MQSSRYRRIFPGTVLDKKAQDSLTTTKGGQRYATSVTGPIAGFRADLIVIDDPMQPNEVASENAKQKLRDWYCGGADAAPEHRGSNLAKRPAPRPAEQPRTPRTRNDCHNAPCGRIFSVRSTGL